MVAVMYNVYRASCIVIRYKCLVYRNKLLFCFFFQAEDGIRDTDRSRGLGDVYKRQIVTTGVSWP